MRIPGDVSGAAPMPWSSREGPVGVGGFRMHMVDDATDSVATRLARQTIAEHLLAARFDLVDAARPETCLHVGPWWPVSGTWWNEPQGAGRSAGAVTTRDDAVGFLDAMIASAFAGRRPA